VLADVTWNRRRFSPAVQRKEGIRGERGEADAGVRLAALGGFLMGYVGC
jgi:hypothetical protein